MGKTDLLLQMLEHPEQYSDEQWKEMLGNQECRELYDMLSQAESAIRAKRAETLSDQEIEKQWQYFSANWEMRKHASFVQHWHKIAAIVIAFVIVSGITLAAIRSGLFRKQQPAKTEVVSVEKSSAKVGAVETRLDTVPAQKQALATPVLFDNETLGKVMPEIATYYKMQLSWKSKDIQQLRLFFRWNRADSIEQVVEALNNFQQFHIAINGTTLIIE